MLTSIDFRVSHNQLKRGVDLKMKWFETIITVVRPCWFNALHVSPLDVQLWSLLLLALSSDGVQEQLLDTDGENEFKLYI